MRTTRRRVLAALTAAVAVAGVLTVTGALAGPACSSSGAGGDWLGYGNDPRNSRTQPREHTISARNAAQLHRVWSFYAGEHSGALGPSYAVLNANPAEAGGCVYVGVGTTVQGEPNVYALDVADGRVVWRQTLEVRTFALGGTVVGTPVVDGDRLVVAVNEEGDGRSRGPHAVALDRRTGAVLWTSRPFVTDAGYYTNGGVAVGRGVAVIGFSAPEGDDYGHGGFAVVDDRTGALLARTFTVPPSSWGTRREPREAGGGIWSTAAVDVADGYAYLGAGNPFSKKTESRNTDAILKVDIARQRATFGRIVGAYKGTIDQSLDAVREATRPTCDLAPDSPMQGFVESDPRAQGLQMLLGNSMTCGQLDLDFGASPNLFTDATGRLVVGELQKSGTYHAVYADTMRRAWLVALGQSCHACNGSSTAYDPSTRSLYADASPGTVLERVAGDGKGVRWAAPVGDGVHYQPVSVANGVVYTVDNGGFLSVYDAATGSELLRAATAVDGGPDNATLSSGGVTIARHTVLVEAGSYLVAYRTGATASP